MKILQILPSLEVGGVERGVIDLSRAVKKRGEEMIVISSGGALVTELQKIGVKHYQLPVHKKSFFSLGLVSKIAEIIEKERVDIVHARSRVPAWLAWLAARKANCAFMTTCHGYYSDNPFSNVMGWGKRVIVISRVIGRHMIDDFGVAPERIRLVHRGVDLSQFVFMPKIKRDKHNPRPFRIINVGRLSPIKGQVEFVKAVHEVRKRIPNLEVWIVGSEGKGKTKYTEEIRQTIRQLNLESCVQMLGTRRDIPELMRQSDLLVLGTLVPEAFGRVIVEAGAMGTPVVTTALGGVVDIIDSGENGLLVLPGDIPAMAKAMIQVLENPALAQDFAEKLREKVNRQFSLDQMTDATLKVYKEVLQEKKILVIKLGALGDVILAVPSLRMLRDRYPDAWISVMVDRKFAALLAKSPYINEIIPVDRERLSKLKYFFRTAKRIRKEGFDISLDFQNSKWTHLLAYLGGVRERFGFKRGFWGWLLNRSDANAKAAESPVKHQFRLLSRLGIREYDESLELWTEPESERKIEVQLGNPNGRKKVGFVIGSSPNWETKRWPVEKFMELADRLVREERCDIILLGSKDEAGLGKMFDGKASVLNLVGKTSLEDLTSLVKRLNVLVTGDTAPLHIAAAMQTPIVALFGPTDPKRHMPPARHSAVISKSLACQPCYEGTCKNQEKLACLQQISVQEVFLAVQRNLTRKDAPQAVKV